METYHQVQFHTLVLYLLLMDSFSLIYREDTQEYQDKFSIKFLKECNKVNNSFILTKAYLSRIKESNK